MPETPPPGRAAPDDESGQAEADLETMSNQVYMITAGQTALARRMDVLANNIANANTDGFRAQMALHAPNKTNVSPGLQSAIPGRTQAAFPVDAGTLNTTAPGSMRKTGNALDVAIQGNGMLSLAGPDGPLYTRNGALARGPEGQLLHGATGLPVLDAGGAEIVLPAGTGSVSITQDGAILGADGVPVGQLGLTTFPDPTLLERQSGKVFQATEGAGAPEVAADVQVKQGWLEGSNVDPMRELTRMIQTSRDFQQLSAMQLSKAQGGDKTIDTLGRLTR